jgi:hypothetical protein
MPPSRGRNYRLGGNDIVELCAKKRNTVLRYQFLVRPPFSGKTPVVSSACIIPVVGNTDGLESTLLSVLERRPDNCEVVVVLNTQYDDPFDLQSEIQFIKAPPAASTVDCINCGIAAAKAPIVHVLAKGFEAANGWLEKATQRFADPSVAAVIPLVYEIANPEQLLAAGVGYWRGGRRLICRRFPAPDHSSALVCVGPLLEAASYRKAALKLTGHGLPVSVGERLANIELAMTLKQAGWQIVVDPNCRVNAASVGETPLNGFHSGLCHERLFWHHAANLGWVRETFAHFGVALGDLVQCDPWWKAPAQALGRMVAVCQLGHYRQYRQTLASNAAEMNLSPTPEAESGAGFRDSVFQHRIDSSHTLHATDGRAPAVPNRLQNSR